MGDACRGRRGGGGGCGVLGGAAAKARDPRRGAGQVAAVASSPDDLDPEAVVDEAEPAPSADPEAPEADAVEQALEVPEDEEEDFR